MRDAYITNRMRFKNISSDDAVQVTTSFESFEQVGIGLRGYGGNAGVGKDHFKGNNVISGPSVFGAQEAEAS